MQAPALHPGHNESESACSHQQGSRCARLSLKNTALKHCKYWIDRQVAKLNKTHPPLGYQNFSHTTNFLRQPCFLSWAQSLSHVWPFATPWTAACQASLSITSSQNLLKLMSIESVMPSNYLILYLPLLLLPSIIPSIRVFSNESVVCISWWPKYWSFSFNISPSTEYSGLISFRIGCLDLLAIQGTLKNLLQYHSSKASVLWRSAFFTVQLSHNRASDYLVYMTGIDTFSIYTISEWICGEKTGNFSY